MGKCTTFGPNVVHFPVRIKYKLIQNLTTHMSSYHCSDNVSIEWNKGNQSFKLFIVYSIVNWSTTGIDMHLLISS
jgi:hypothetical protein